MKIKQMKKMRLDELIKYIFDNGIEDRAFLSNGGVPFNMSEVRISGSGNIKINGYIGKYTTFTVEVEEELTEDTSIGEIWGLGVENVSPITMESYMYDSDNIRGVLSEAGMDKDIYIHSLYKITDGCKLVTVWSAENGIPTEGVIEVD